MNRPFTPKVFSPRLPGFTLVELLVVIAIIGILTAMVTPSLPAILGSKSVEKAAAEISGVLETARAEAMSKRTYVHVVFTNATNAERNSEIRIGALASMDGTADVSNLRGVSKVIKVDKARLVGYGELPNGPDNTGGMKDAADRASKLQNSPDFTVNDDYALNTGFLNSARATPINFSSIGGFKNNFPASLVTYVITISPSGEVQGASSPDFFRRVIHFGIAETRRDKLDDKSQNGAIVTYFGGSGRIGTLRP